MTTDTKKLAEFAAEFLDGYIKKYRTILVIGGYVDDEDMVFHHPMAPAILAHLAKREMEKRLWEWNSSYDLSGFQPGEKIHGQYCFGILTAPKCTVHSEQDENEYIALWSAIEATGEK